MANNSILKTIFVVLAIPGLWGVASAQTAPEIRSVTNAASNIPQGLPNAGMALGSMFVVKGTGLGPETLVIADRFPLQTSLSGTSVQVSVAGRSATAILYYTSAKQLAAILPSNTPTGTGNLTVTYNGQTSGVFPIAVVSSNVGLFTMQSTGYGRAIAYLGDGSLVSETNSPRPGEVIVLWATGLGPVTSDETRAAPGGEMTSVPLEAFVGTKAATVVYRGRNPCCTAVDQINIRLPDGMSGCGVPLVLKIGNLVSNTTSLPVAESGRACKPSTVTQEYLDKLKSQPFFTAGFIGMGTERYFIGDSFSASFAKFPSSGLVANALVAPPVGACLVSNGQDPDLVPGSQVTTFLDAGPSLTLSGPTGTKVFPRAGDSGFWYYGGAIGNGPPGNYFEPGEYTVSGSGGPDVGPFSAKIIRPPVFQWTNRESVAAVTRANGLTMTWSGGDPKGYVQVISSGSSAGPRGPVYAGFSCTLGAAEGRITIPDWVLLAIPPSASRGISITASSGREFSAGGIDSVTISFGESAMKTLPWQ